MPTPEENQKAKMDFIDAFFDDFDKKARYLVDIYESGRRDEARILCSCYLDGLASALYWPEERNNFNYVRILKEYGGDKIFGYIHPKMLEEALSKLSKSRGKKWTTIHASLSGKIRMIECRLYEEPEILSLLAHSLETSEIKIVSQELWRGSFAAIIYDRFRIASVHGFGPPDGTTFENTTFQGKPVPPINFNMVHD